MTDDMRLLLRILLEQEAIDNYTFPVSLKQ